MSGFFDWSLFVFRLEDGLTGCDGRFRFEEVPLVEAAVLLTVACWLVTVGAFFRASSTLLAELDDEAGLAVELSSRCLIA